RLELQLGGFDDDDDDVPRNPRPGGGGGGLGGQGLSSGFQGTPGAVPVRADNWDFPRGEYVLEWGDTLSGLAATYLGGAGRWNEIWNAQPGTFRAKRNPSKLGAGERIKMPAEAVTNAKTLLGAPPGSQVAPNGQVVDPSGKLISSVPTWVKVAGLGVGVVALGGAGYAVYKAVA
ncbi:MAG TPA: hypothetical protein PKX87_09140, partial [Alphaproteobacteria bacterium]|nr:hypothetical protein [Alphaproteobacteria bacterium]